MAILIPHSRQSYNNKLAKAVANELIIQDSITVHWAIDKIAKYKSKNYKTIRLEKLIPSDCPYMEEYYKEFNSDKLSLNRKGFICKRLVQFLLWTKDNKVKCLTRFDRDDYKVKLDKIPIENIDLVRYLIEKHFDQLTPEEDYTDVDNICEMLSSLKLDQVEHIFQKFSKSKLLESTKANIN